MVGRDYLELRGQNGWEIDQRVAHRLCDANRMGVEMTFWKTAWAVVAGVMLIFVLLCGGLLGLAGIGAAAGKAAKARGQMKADAEAQSSAQDPSK